MNSPQDRSMTVTFHGNDPDKVASSALCVDGATKCQARTRAYRNGALAADGFPLAEISDYLASDDSTVVWLDLRNPDQVVNALMRRDLHIVSDDMMPYFQDVYDHVLRAAEWTDSLRDLVTSILETNLTIQGNRLNNISKKVTGWAAIIAVPTFITGFYGMNVPYPFFGREPGFAISITLMVVAMILLYITFRRRDWL